MQRVPPPIYPPRSTFRYLPQQLNRPDWRREPKGNILPQVSESVFKLTQQPLKGVEPILPRYNPPPLGIWLKGETPISKGLCFESLNSQALYLLGLPASQ